MAAWQRVAGVRATRTTSLKSPLRRFVPRPNPLTDRPHVREAAPRKRFAASGGVSGPM